MHQYTIHPLVVGINETDQGVMTYLRDYGKRIYLPIQKIKGMADILIPLHDLSIGRMETIP